MENITLDPPIVEISGELLNETLAKLFGDNTFPENLVIVNLYELKKHLSFSFQDIKGLAVFSTEGIAIRFIKYLEDISSKSPSPFSFPEYKLEIVTFDEARDIAKSKGAPIVALLLLDNIDNPVIHYIN